MSQSSQNLRRPHYTEQQIRDKANSLPGFNSDADVFDIFEKPQEYTLWQPVLSATVITRMEGSLHILTGNRRAAGNITHTNVASTPTIRIPYPDTRFVIGDRIPFNLGGNIAPTRPFVSPNLDASTCSIPDNTDVLGFKVDHLLSAKLALGPTLELSKRKVGRASIARCVVGFSYLQDNEMNQPLYEPLIMLGAVVGLEPEAAKMIPNQTASYSNLGWVPLSKYAKGVATKNLLDVLPSASLNDELEVCVRGLCNATSSTIVKSEREIQEHLTERGILEPF